MKKCDTGATTVVNVQLRELFSHPDHYFRWVQDSCTILRESGMDRTYRGLKKDQTGEYILFKGTHRAFTNIDYKFNKA